MCSSIKTYLVIPGLLVVVDNSSTETPSRVDTSASDGDGSQVNHEHGEPNRKGSQDLRSTTVYMHKN